MTPVRFVVQLKEGFAYTKIADRRNHASFLEEGLTRIPMRKV